MSISAVNGNTPGQQQTELQAVKAGPTASSFGDHLDAQGAPGHHHLGGALQSLASSAAAAASVAGVASPATLAASAMLHLLS